MFILANLFKRLQLFTSNQVAGLGSRQSFLNNALQLRYGNCSKFRWRSKRKKEREREGGTVLPPYSEHPSAVVFFFGPRPHVLPFVSFQEATVVSFAASSSALEKAKRWELAFQVAEQLQVRLEVGKAVEIDPSSFRLVIRLFFGCSKKCVFFFLRHKKKVLY